MPKELKSLQEIDDKLFDRTLELRLKKAKDAVKVKFRTISKLYTIKVSPEEAETLEAKAKSKGINVVTF